jgi:hypothetical protein
MNRRILKLIAAVQIVGGFVGMALASGSAVGSRLNLLDRIFTGSLGIPFALCAVAGRDLWLDRPRGYLLSVLVQAAQLFAWSSPNVLYVFHCGAQLGVWLGKAAVAPLWGLGSRLTLNVIEWPRGEAVGINFLALATLGYLIWATARRAPGARGLEEAGAG